MTRALFLTSYPLTAAATRYRLHQFFPYLEAHGVQCRLSPFLSETVFRELYSRKGVVAKTAQLLALAVRRIAEVGRSSPFDVVVVQRDAMLFGPPIVEWLLARVLRKPLVFDFDDAIWLHYKSPTWGSWAVKLKFPGKTSQIIRMAAHVIVGNEYTRDYALRFRSERDVSIIPTVVDAEEFRPVERDAAETPVVGWIGTHSTAQYLEEIAEPLQRCARRHPFRLKVVGAGRDLSFPGIEIENKPWRLDEELADYRHLDVGLYPIRDDEWGRGKAGFKAIVYMSCGVASICSPVGGVTETIRHGVNGLLARSPEEWESSLERLLSDVPFRRRLGVAGRESVLRDFSLEVQAPRFAAILEQAAASRPRVGARRAGVDRPGHPEKH